MKVRRHRKPTALRLHILFGCMCLAFGVLLFTLFRLQVYRQQDFAGKLERQSIRRVRLPGIRGRVFDRNGLCIADNRPVCNLAIFLEELRHWNLRIDGKRAGTTAKALTLLDRVSEQIGLPREVSEKEILTHLYKRKPLPLLAWEDLDQAALSRWAEKVPDKNYMDVYLTAARVYPQGSLFAHLLGYVGRADPPQNDEPYDYYLPELAGRGGIEKVMDATLRGQAGGSLVQIEVSGFRHEELAVREPGIGGDVRLTVDAGIQQAARDALGEDPGAAVVLDPNNGDVLALVSSPDYDLNHFVPAIPASVWNELRNNTDTPLLNRAVAGTYPPGSTFKPLVCLAALQQMPAFATIEHRCPGYFKLGKATFRCWKRSGHGTVDLRETLKYSCNVFMYEMALEIGMQPIHDNAAAIGLGQKTGIELDFERPGLLPSKEWKQRERGAPWSDGDTCNLSIGQGFLLVTPLQMAMVSAVIANRGIIYRPRLIEAVRAPGSDEFAPMPVRRAGRMNWLPESVELVRQGMRDVVMAPDGTGKNARVDGWDFAAKTGSAEYGAKGSGKVRCWMIGFAPYDNPRYAVAFMLDNGVSGGTSAGPKMKQLMQYLYGREQKERNGE